jgi:hypothetical protein
MPPEALRGARVVIDGYNLLITTKSMLSGGVLLWGRDGWILDRTARWFNLLIPLLQTQQPKKDVIDLRS